MSKYQALIDAPSLHDQIMNLPCKPENMDSEPNQRLAYKVGHRDARHAAAELAQAQDATIRALLADLERAEKALREIDDDFAREGFSEKGPYREPVRAALAQMAGGG